MSAAKRTKARAVRVRKADLEEFFERYLAILTAAKEFVERVGRAAALSGESPYVPTRLIAQHIAEHAPAAYLKTFGTDEPLKLKVWRLKTILSNARYLGAFKALGLITTQGKGVSADVPKLRVVK